VNKRFQRSALPHYSITAHDVSNTASQVYDVVTALWKEVGNRYKNYVDFPKPNGYRSIHTTVQHQSGMLLEVQVCLVIATISSFCKATIDFVAVV
jgi:ppGpp synthetase/RelA/SpoT-type nucleotidyltranferase